MKCKTRKKEKKHEHNGCSSIAVLQYCDYHDIHTHRDCTHDKIALRSFISCELLFISDLSVHSHTHKLTDPSFHMCITLSAFIYDSFWAIMACGWIGEMGEVLVASKDLKIFTSLWQDFNEHFQCPSVVEGFPEGEDLYLAHQYWFGELLVIWGQTRALRGWNECLF